MSAPPDLVQGVEAGDFAAARASRTLGRSSIKAAASSHSIALACAATLVIHLLSLTRQLGSDEGGFAMVARHWRDGGPYLYGTQWVDRPPGLIAVFDAAQHLGPYGVRLTSTILAVLLVAAVSSAAGAIGGRPAARWAAWTAFAFASSALLQAQALNGELAAATFVSISVAALLRSLLVSTGPAPTVALGSVAGEAASLAMLMKQNFADAFVFATVLLVAGTATRKNRLRYPPSKVSATAAGFAAGAVAPALLTWLWATGHGGMSAFLYANLGFRGDASAVMASWSWDEPLSRLRALALLALLSGLLLLLGHLVVSHRCRILHLDPLPWAIAATVSFELFGILAGANFWAHYLIALIPMVALAAGLSTNYRTPGHRWTRRLVLLGAATTALVSPIAAINAAHTTSAAYTTGRWIAMSAHSGDSIVVPFTHANVINAADLAPGYPYAWSLPIRTLDPDLSLLTSTLTGTSAPTWVVRWDGAHTWGLDPDNHVEAALRAYYRPVAVVCGHTVWLHDGATRRLALLPSLSACGADGQSRD